jgi:malonyl-CoA decarboxylase
VVTLRRSFASPRRAFLGTLANLPGGIGVILGMREDMLEASRRHGQRFDGLDSDMVELLEEWFCQGLLSLKEIDQRSPFQTIRFLHEHELVHPALRLEDMGRRVGGNRRCFALSHCATPDEPMVFVEVVLRRGMARAIHDILDCDDTATDQRRPDTAIFYSINNAQPGLTGLGLGSVLIYRVVAALRCSVPSLDTFATLSPSPGSGDTSCARSSPVGRAG